MITDNQTNNCYQYGYIPPYSNYQPVITYAVADYRVDQLLKEVSELKEQMAKLKAAFDK